jgi:hypothetical protein
MKVVFNSEVSKLSGRNRHHEVIATYTNVGDNCPLSCVFHPENESPYKCYTLKGRVAFHNKNGGIDVDKFRNEFKKFFLCRDFDEEYKYISLVRFHEVGDIIDPKTEKVHAEYVNAIVDVCEQLLDVGITIIGYTHCWQDEDAQPLKRYFMASCDTYEQIAEARALGWMCTTVKQGNENAVLQDDVKIVPCPNQITNGRIKCIDCMLCSPSRFKSNATRRVIQFNYH